jgi:hypothetical protein
MLFEEAAATTATTTTMTMTEAVETCSSLNKLSCVVYTVGWRGMDWIDLAQDRDWWKALKNMVVNLRVP